MIGAAAVGLAAGVVAGMLGIGGGVLFVPALVIFMDVSQLEGEATSLLAIVPVAIVGAWRQHRYGNVRVREGIALGALSIAGVLVGVVVANAVSERALEVGFAILLLVAAVQLVRHALREEGSAAGDRPAGV